MALCFYIGRQHALAQQQRIEQQIAADERATRDSLSRVWSKQLDTMAEQAIHWATIAHARRDTLDSAIATYQRLRAATKRTGGADTLPPVDRAAGGSADPTEPLFRACDVVVSSCQRVVSAKDSVIAAKDSVIALRTSQRDSALVKLGDCQTLRLREKARADAAAQSGKVARAWTTAGVSVGSAALGGWLVGKACH